MGIVYKYRCPSEYPRSTLIYLVLNSDERGRFARAVEFVCTVWRLGSSLPPPILTTSLVPPLLACPLTANLSPPLADCHLTGSPSHYLPPRCL
jgi:hypothetical protein